MISVGIHQGSLLFIIVLKALSRHFRTGLPWELLHSHYVSRKREGVQMESMESSSIRLNISKAKVMMSSVVDSLPMSRKDVWLCAVCKKGVAGNTILCTVCSDWV